MKFPPKTKIPALSYRFYEIRKWLSIGKSHHLLWLSRHYEKDRRKDLAFIEQLDELKDYYNSIPLRALKPC